AAVAKIASPNRLPRTAESRLVPAYARQDPAHVDLRAVLEYAAEHRGDDVVGHRVRLEAELEQGRVTDVVVVLFLFLARVRDALRLDGESHAAPNALNLLRDLAHRKCLGQLVHDVQLA